MHYLRDHFSKWHDVFSRVYGYIYCKSSRHCILQINLFHDVQHFMRKYCANLNIVFLIVKKVTWFSVITVLRKTNARKRCKFCKMCYVGQILFSVEQILISYNWFGNLFIYSIAMWNKYNFKAFCILLHRLLKWSNC